MLCVNTGRITIRSTGMNEQLLEQTIYVQVTLERALAQPSHAGSMQSHPSAKLSHPTVFFLLGICNTTNALFGQFMFGTNSKSIPQIPLCTELDSQGRPTSHNKKLGMPKPCLKNCELKARSLELGKKWAPTQFSLAHSSPKECSESCIILSVCLGHCKGESRPRSSQSDRTYRSWSTQAY